jgi:hypothetical protein
MRKPVFALFALAISLFGTQCWAQENCTPGEEGVTCNFSPGITEGVYDFTSTGDGKLTVDFVKVLTTFTLTVTVDHAPNSHLPEGGFHGATCVIYETNGSQCDEYNFTGNAGGPNGVPVRGHDYTNMINLTLSYLSSQTAHKPDFLHAPGDNSSAVYSEDILTAYSPLPLCGGPCDPTMDGTLPGLSRVAAFDEPGGTDCFVFVSPTEGQIFQVGHEIEVEFRLFDNTACTGDPIRDKDARVSLAMTDCHGNFISFPPLRNKGEGNKFHFDHEDGVNELDLSTEGLAPGCYTVTVFSDEFSLHFVDITLTPRPDDHDHDHDHDHDPD